MTGRTFALAAAALIAAMGPAAPALPQDVTAPCRLCDSTGKEAAEKPPAPVSLDIETSLDFGKLVLAGTGDGRAELGADGSRRVAGSVSAMSARTMVGEVVIRGEPGRLVRVELPRRIQLTGLAGGSIELETIRSDLPDMPRLDGNGRLRFRFGGVLQISGDLDGEFRGDVPIEVDYF